MVWQSHVLCYVMSCSRMHSCLRRCVRPDQSSATVRLHYLEDGNVNFAFTINRAEYFIPVVLLFKGLAEVTHFAVLVGCVLHSTVFHANAPCVRRLLLRMSFSRTYHDEH